MNWLLNEKLWMNLVAAEIFFIMWVLFERSVGYLLVFGISQILYFLIGNFRIEREMKQKENQKMILNKTEVTKNDIQRNKS